MSSTSKRYKLTFSGAFRFEYVRAVRKHSSDRFFSLASPSAARFYSENCLYVYLEQTKNASIILLENTFVLYRKERRKSILNID